MHVWNNILLLSFGFPNTEYIGSNEKTRVQYKHNEYVPFTQQGTNRRLSTTKLESWRHLKIVQSYGGVVSKRYLQITQWFFNQLKSLAEEEVIWTTYQFSFCSTTTTENHHSQKLSERKGSLGHMLKDQVLGHAV